MLKAKRGAHEVITTMMMNFIALAATNYLISSRFHMPETVHTAEIAEGAWLGRFDRFLSMFQGSPVNTSLLLALGLCALFWYVLWRTPLGYEWRAVGDNARAAKVGGVPVERRILEALVVSGGLAGLASVNFILGYKHYFEQGFATGQGFSGIAVAILGRNHPVGVILAALLFGSMAQASLSVNRWVPKEILEIAQALVIFGVVLYRARQENARA